MAICNETCRICESRYVLYAQDVIGARTKQFFKQKFCMDCRSFYHTSGYQENDAQQLADFEYLFAHREGHAALQSQLVLELTTFAPGIQTVLEIGHGAGLFLRACRDYGLDAVGFEVNPHCHRFSVDQLGVKSTLGYFDAEHGKKYDLIVALQVFEHLENPRALFKLMRDHLNPDGLIYLSVPFVERRQWRYLWSAGKDVSRHPADVFYDNDVHITHFSIDGMRSMGMGLGARDAQYFVSKDVYQQSPGSYQGILFRF